MGGNNTRDHYEEPLMKSRNLLFSLVLAAFTFSAPAVAEHHEEEKKDMMMGMTHVSITHEVEDGDHWLAAWDGENSRHEDFKANGAKHVHVLSDPDNPNVKGLIVAVADMDAFLAFLESDEGGALAAKDGVRMDTLVMLVEAK
jgi:hypothetical protein